METRIKFNAEKYDQEEEWKFATRPESNHYERIGLDPESKYSTREIDEAYQARVNWWKERKKQRDRGEENNPLVKKVLPYIDDALRYLGQAGACLSSPDAKLAYDRTLEKSRSSERESAFLGFIAFTLRDRLLTTTEKRDLLEQARELGVTHQRAEQLIWEEMAKCGARQVSDEEIVSQASSQGDGRPAASVDPPRLVMDQTSFSLGTLRRGQRRDCKVTLDNRGGGVLEGSIESSNPDWLILNQTAIDARRHHQDISFSVSTDGLALGRSYVGTVEVHSNGGRGSIRIDFSIELELAAISRFRKKMFWLGLLGGLIFGLLIYSLTTDVFTANTIAEIAGLVGYIAFIVVCAKAGGWGGGIGAFFLALIVESILKHTSMRAYSGSAWAAVVSAFAYFSARRLLIARLSNNSRTKVWVAISGVSLVATIFLIGLGFAIELKPQSNLRVSTLPIEDKLIGSSIGSSTGVSWEHALGDRGAVFSAANSSRIEYPGLIPSEGTLEFWLKVDSGYQYVNYQFRSNQNDAMIFSSDVQGGDVTWPGTTKIFVTRDGGLSIWMATVRGENHVAATEARKTKFRFGEWHAIGVSYGSQGQYIMLDGKLVASSPRRTQTFGAAGNQQSPLDIPTIGETVSHFFAPHQYSGGFEGVLAAFRVSANQRDWQLAAGIKNEGTTDNPLSGQTGSASDTSQSNIGGIWQGVYIDHGTSHAFDMNLSQSGTQVTGSIDEPQGTTQQSQADVTGTVEDTHVQFIKKYRNNATQFSYSGLLSTNGLNITGSWSGGGFFGSWQAARPSRIENTPQEPSKPPPSSATSETTSTASQTTVTSEPVSVPQGPTVQQWISLAQSQFEHSDYQEAVRSCDAALRMEPGNIEASQLRTKIQKTMSILGKN